MLFIETPVFTKQVVELLSDEEYAAFQRVLVRDPSAGDVIRNTGGLRKIRVAAGGRGKRGGARVIYFHVSARGEIRLLLIYAKGVKDNLTPAETAVLRALNRDW